MTLEDLAHVSWMMDTLGCAIAEARPPDGESRWAYTVGLNGIGLPELVVFGLPRDVSIPLLADLVRSARAGECDLHPCTGPVWWSVFGAVSLQPFERAERYLKRADAWEGFEEQEWSTDDGETTYCRVLALQVVLDIEQHGALPEAHYGTRLTEHAPSLAEVPR